MSEISELLERLLPCPFCGGPAKEPMRYNGTWETGCAGPHECPGTDVIVPLAAWNRRALPSQESTIQALTKRVEASNDALGAAYDFLGGVSGAVEVRSLILTALHPSEPREGKP